MTRIYNEKAEGDYIILDGQAQPLGGMKTTGIPATRYSFYEVLRVMKGSALFLEDHLNRLAHSLEKYWYTLPLSKTALGGQVNQLIYLNNKQPGKVKIRIDYHEKKEHARVSIFYIPYHYPDSKLYNRGIQTVTFSYERNNPGVKLFNSTLRKKADEIINQNRVYEVLLTDHDDCITEGSRSNVFFTRQGIVYTPPVEQVLPGITRQKIQEICHREKIKWKEERIPVTCLGNFQGAFISGTSPKILPISGINELFFDSQEKTTRYLMKAYDQEIERYIKQKT